MHRLLIQVQLHSTLRQTKGSLGIQRGKMLDRPIKGFQKKNSIWKNCLNFLGTAKMASPVSDRRCKFMNRFGRWQRCQLTQQQLLFTSSSRLKPHQQLVQNRCGRKGSICHQSLLLSFWDGLQQHLNAPLLGALELVLSKSIRQSRLDLNPLQRSTVLPGVIERLCLSHSCFPPPASHTTDVLHHRGYEVQPIPKLKWR